MVGPRLAAIHKVITHELWERQIGKPVAVKVPELNPAHAELDPAEAMGRGANPGPPQHLLGDAVVNTGHSTTATGKRGRGFPLGGTKRSNLLDISRT
jgi:hypothetical protein